jgi:hypothetical protein
MLILACFAGLFALSSFFTPKNHTNLNQNGWSICIGKKEILMASRNHRGDTAYIKRKTIRANDSIFVREFICGGTIKPPQVSLHLIKDNAPAIHIELTYIRGAHFYPLNRLSEFSDFEKLGVEIHSSYNYYYPEIDKDKPMATIIIS